MIRTFITRSSTKYWINLVLVDLIVLGIVSLIDVIATNHNQRFDLTATKQFSLSPQTTKILKSLKRDVKATVFYQSRSGERFELKDILSRYTAQTKKFHYELVNLDRNPGKAKEYGVHYYGTTMMESGDRKVMFPYPNEDRIVNAILKLTREEEKRVYFLQGHGEKDPFDFDKRHGYSEAKIALEKEDYIVKKLLLMREGAVPPSTSLLVVSGPQKDFFPEEIEAISQFLQKGGSALFMIDPYTAPSLNSYLDQYGIIVGNDIIVDQYNRLFAGEPLTPLIPFYPEHPITKDFYGPNIFSLAQSVDVRETPVKGVYRQSIVKSSPRSWAETDRESVKSGELDFQEGKDKIGPISVGVVVSIDVEKRSSGKGKEEGDKRGKIVVYGDSDFASNLYIPHVGNKDLFMNTVSWLVEQENLITIRPKTTQPTTLSFIALTARQGKMIFWSAVIIEPALILMVGIIVYVRRRITG